MPRMRALLGLAMLCPLVLSAAGCAGVAYGDGGGGGDEYGAGYYEPGGFDYGGWGGGYYVGPYRGDRGFDRGRFREGGFGDRDVRGGGVLRGDREGGIGHGMPSIPTGHGFGGGHMGGGHMGGGHMGGGHMGGGGAHGGGGGGGHGR